MQRAFFIVNPVAGSGRSEKGFAQVRAALDAEGADYGFALTTAPKHAEELAREALDAGERFIVAVGGDGTLNEVAGVLFGTEAVLGLLPFGTGNDFARAVKLPVEPMAALNVLKNGAVRRLDVGKANGKLFFNVAGVGFDVDVLVNTERYKKRFNGMLPYMLGIFSTLRHLKTLNLTLVADGQTIRQDSLLVVISNGTHFGGGMNVAPGADPFDGKFNVCLIEKVSALRLLTLLPGFVKGRHLGYKVVRSFNAAEISVECQEPFTVEVDGELELATPVTFTVCPGAMNIVVEK